MKIKQSKRLYRSLNSRLIAGVCGGLADYFNIDPSFIRIIALLLTLAGGVTVFIYIAMWIIVPEKRII
jgi:phage shock protein C